MSRTGAVAAFITGKANGTPMTDEPRRPNPGELLARLREQEGKAYHEDDYGDLRLYLGAAPGMGKTYAMLEEAHRLRAQGVDVVVGFVETHGRAETLAAFATEQRVTQIAIGHPQKSRWEECVRGSTASRPLRLCRTADILIVADE